MDKSLLSFQLGVSIILIATFVESLFVALTPNQTIYLCSGMRTTGEFRHHRESKRTMTSFRHF